MLCPYFVIVGHGSRTPFSEVFAKKGESSEKEPENPNGWILTDRLPEPGIGQCDGGATSFVDQEHGDSDSDAVGIGCLVEQDMVHLLVGKLPDGVEAVVEVRLKGAAM